MGHTTQALRSAGWSVLQIGGSRAMSIVVFFVLAHLLDPVAFGPVTLAAVVLSVAAMLLDMGFAEAIVQRQHLEPQHVESAFWASLLVAVAALLLTCAVAAPMARWFNEPLLEGPLKVIALTYPLLACDGVLDALMRRKLAFKRLACRKLVATAISGMLGIWMALQGYGMWALVGKAVAETVIGTVMLWAVCRWYPRGSFSWPHLCELTAFGVNMLCTRAVGLLNHSADKWIIGYLLGVTPLGVYGVAQRLVAAPIELVPGAAARVTGSVFARLQFDIPRVKSALLRAQQFCALLSFPLFIGLALIAPDLIPVMLGEQWNSAIPVVQIFCVGGLLFATNYLTASAWIALGKADWYFRWTVLNAALNVLGFAIGARWGIAGVAAAYVVRGYALFPVSLVLSRRLLGISPRELFAATAGPAMAACFMAACTFGVARLFLDGQPSVLRLAVLLPVGAATYMAACTLLARRAAQEAIAVLSAAFPPLTGPLRLLSGAFHNPR